MSKKQSAKNQSAKTEMIETLKSEVSNVANIVVSSEKLKSEISKQSEINTKVNEILYSDMMKNLDKSLFVTNKGTNKENLYKSEIFKNLSETEKKSLRRKIRSVRESFIYSFLRTTNKENLQKLFIQFQNFCVNTYNFQFTIENMKVENFCSSNTTEKENLNKAITIIKLLF
jgi:hypothetical protein